MGGKQRRTRQFNSRSSLVLLYTQTGTINMKISLREIQTLYLKKIEGTRS